MEGKLSRGSIEQFMLGTWPLSGNEGVPGYGPAERGVAIETIQTAVTLGIRSFDTADIYGAGFAEELLGEVLSSIKEPTIVCTKGGWDVSAASFNGNPDFLRERVIQSQERLRRDVIDIYLLHCPPAEWSGNPRLYSPLIELKDKGVLARIGLSVGEPADAWAALHVPGIDVIQIPYNFVCSEADQGFLQEALQVGKTIMAREVFGNGLLTGKYAVTDRFRENDFRSSWDFALRMQIADTMKFWEPYKVEGESWMEFALRFALDRSEFSSVVVGARSPEQVAGLVELISNQSAVN